MRLNSFLFGMNDSRANISLCLLLSSSVSKLTQLNMQGILGNFQQKFHLLLTHISSVQLMFFTICGICGLFAITLIWIVKNYLQLFFCQVVSIIAIPFCLVSRTLTSSNFSIFRIDTPTLVTKSPQCTCSVPLLHSLHWLPVRLRILFKVTLLTYKTLREEQPVYLHFMLATSLPSGSVRSNKGISLSVPGSRSTQVKKLFTLVLHILGTTCRCLSVQPFQEASEDTSL